MTRSISKPSFSGGGSTIEFLIPAGSYVQGGNSGSQAPWQSERHGRRIRLRLNSMILPNGYVVDFNAVPTNAGTRGAIEATDSEGKIHGDTDKG